MAYATKYQIPFLNRKGIGHTVNLALKDYVGAITTLPGSPDAFMLNYESGDNSIINPVRASECSVNFYNDGPAPLTAFYSEDDEAWLITLLHDATGQILWRGFLVQDDCQEVFQDPPHVIQLRGTDNLGLLKNIPFNEAWNQVTNKTLYESGARPVVIEADLKTIHIAEPVIVTSVDTNKMNLLFIYGVFYTILSASFTAPVLTIKIVETFAAAVTDPSESYEIYTIDPVVDKFPLFKYLQVALLRTGIALPLEIYSNLYENSEQDRGDLATADMFQQEHLYSGMFLSDRGEWASCYSILETILGPLNATLQQARGKWEIVRWPELRLFASNAIPGTAYDAAFANPTAVSLAPNIQVATGSNMVFMNADATRSILRPFKNVKRTFNYKQPKELIVGSDLRKIGNLIATRTAVIDGVTFRYDDYEIPSDWKHTESDTSFITIVTNTSTDPETETERYVTTPGYTDEQGAVKFNNIEVSKGDLMDFSLQFRTETDSSDFLRFWILFMLYGTDGKRYIISGTDAGAGHIDLFWAELIGSPPIVLGINMYIPSAQDTSQFTTWGLSSFSLLDKKKLLIPQDGILQVSVRGTNGASGDPRQRTLWNDIAFTVTNYINQSTKINGQIHNTSIAASPKNKLEDEVLIDDSPRNTIAGTLYRSQTINFGYDIGPKHFIKTKAWHRGTTIETRRLGEITTREREQIQSTPRTIMEGTIDHNDPFVSLLNVVKIDTLPAVNFILGVCEFNFMESMFRATLWEIHAGESNAAMTYSFNYIYQVS